MRLNQRNYLCAHCHHVIDDIEKLLFVEEASNRGFCSESCIENFYTSLFSWYENQEKNLRDEFNLINEDCPFMINDPGLIDKLLSFPDEIWCLRNDLGEEIYSFIGKYQDQSGNSYFLLSLCLLYDKRPSFILMTSCTRSKKLVDQFKIGEKIENVEMFLKESKEEMIEVDGGPAAEMESKKSGLLAEILERRSPADIPFESFSLYDTFFEGTVEAPDETYSYIDDEGDKIYIYIKAHDKDGVSFFYFVISMNFNGHAKENVEPLLPILSFPSVDPDLYRFYCKGKKLTGSLKS